MNNKDNKYNNEDNNNYDPKQSESGYDSEYTHRSWDPNAMSRPRAKYESREPLDSRNVDKSDANNDSSDTNDSNGLNLSLIHISEPTRQVR